MESKKYQFYFLVVILAATLVLSFFIIRPFVHALALGVIFAVIFQPLQRKMLQQTGQRHGLAAFFTIIIFIIFLLIPLTFLGVQIFQEAQQLYTHLGEASREGGAFNVFRGFTENLQTTYPSLQSFSLDADQLLKRGLELMVQNFGNLFSSVVKTIGSLFVFLLVLYYVLKDGVRLKKIIIAASPLADTDDEKISHELALAVNSVVKGNLMIACIQGILLAIGFSIFGIPQAILWGTVGAIAALIPSIGTALVIMPGLIFLVVTGQMPQALGLLIWGVVAVGLIDNFLGPRLVGRGLPLHPLLVLLSVLGGIAFFGPTGFLLGPLTLSFVFALMKIYTAALARRNV